MNPTTEKLDYKVKDITLATWGRREIELAEAEMPGLMSLREVRTASRPSVFIRSYVSLARAGCQFPCQA